MAKVEDLAVLERLGREANLVVKVNAFNKAARELAEACRAVDYNPDEQVPEFIEWASGLLDEERDAVHDWLDEPIRTHAIAVMQQFRCE